MNGRIYRRLAGESVMSLRSDVVVIAECEIRQRHAMVRSTGLLFSLTLLLLFCLLRIFRCFLYIGLFLLFLPRFFLFLLPRFLLFFLDGLRKLDP